jgi:cell division protein FtsB
MIQLIATALSTIWLTAVAAILTNLIITRLEKSMSSAINTKLAAQVDQLIAENATLKAQIAAPNGDTQALADEQAAEQAISDKLAAALSPVIVDATAPQ